MTDIDGSYKYACGYYEQIFCNFSARLDHVFADHKVSEGSKKILEKFPCEKCGFILHSRKDLLNHLETHIDRKSRTKRAPDMLKCDLCHSEFTVKKSLDRHMIGIYDEHGTPQYRCDKCDIVFCSGKQLQKHHKETQTDHACSRCDQQFTSKRALEYHIKKQEMLNCSICEKQFFNKKSFAPHMNRH